VQVDFDAFRMAKLRNLVRERATLLQRIADAVHLGLPENGGVIDPMRKRLGAIKTTEDALTYPLWDFMKRQGRDPLSAFLKHRRVRQKLLRSYRASMNAEPD
jgi:hypothetical protein